MKKAIVTYTDPSTGKKSEYATVHAFEYFFGLKYDTALKRMTENEHCIGKINVDDVKGKMTVMPLEDFDKLLYFSTASETMYGNDPSNLKKIERKEESERLNKIWDWRDFLKREKVNDGNLEAVIYAMGNIIENQSAEIDNLKRQNKNIVVKKEINPFNHEVTYFTDPRKKNYNEYLKWLKADPNHQPKKP